MRKEGRVVIEEFTSAILKGNPWKDPHVRKLPVYLPPSYDTSPKRRYPVLWCLTGFTGSGPMLLNLRAFSENLPQQLDRLIGSGAAGECIVAMPDCMTFLGGSQYINSTANGRYEDYLCDELVPFVDSNYRTMADPAHRGVFGKSSGGYGAIILGMRRPGVFGGLACHSGDMAFDLCYRPDFAKTISPLKAHGGVKKFIEKIRKTGKVASADHPVLNSLAMAAAYSPSIGAKQPAFDLPFDQETAELIPSTWERWIGWDPAHMVEKHYAALKSMRLLFVDCGVKDEFYLHLGARVLSRRLKAAGIEHVHEEFDGGHFDIAFRYDSSVPKLVRALR